MIFYNVYGCLGLILCDRNSDRDDVTDLFRERVGWMVCIMLVGIRCGCEMFNF